MTIIPSEEELIKQMTSNPYSYAAIYARISGKNQSESIDTQVSRAKDIAFDKNLLIYQIYKEEISATKNKIRDRQALHKMLEDAKAGYFKYLIVFRRDRLARIFDDYLEIKNKLLKYGVTILFTNDFKIEGVDNSPLSSFLDNIIMAVAELEPKYIRERVSTGLKRKIEKREYFRKPPYGMRLKEVDGMKRYVGEEPGKNYIEYIFKTFCREEINSIKELYNTLDNEELIPETFTKQDIESIITRPIYAGLDLKDKENYHYDGFKIIEVETEEDLPISLSYFYECINIDEIIDKKVWLEVAEKLSKIEKKRNNRVFNPYRKLLENKVFCKKCNEVMKVNGKYYKCHNCDNPIKYEEINYHVKSKLAKEIFNHNWSNKLNIEIQTQLVEKNKELEEVLVKKNISIREQVEKFIEDPTNEFLREIIQNLAHEENLIRKKLEENNSKIRVLKNLDPFVNSQLIVSKVNLEDGNFNSLKEIIDCFVKKVVVDSGAKKYTVEFAK